MTLVHSPRTSHLTPGSDRWLPYLLEKQGHTTFIEIEETGELSYLPPFGFLFLSQGT